MENNFSANSPSSNSSYTAALMFGYPSEIDWERIAAEISAHGPDALQARPVERIIIGLFNLYSSDAEQATEHAAQLAKKITASNIAKITLIGMGVVASHETNLIPNDEIANYRRKRGQIPLTIVRPPRAQRSLDKNQDLAPVIPFRN